jgi:hypothetical protein
MSRKTAKLETRPHYYYGQLLLEEDFLAEQRYHLDARRRHNRSLHGEGVVWGLQVEADGSKSVTVGKGFAIDCSGQEIPLESDTILDLSQFQAGEQIGLELCCEEGGENEQDTRRISYAVLTAVPFRDCSKRAVLLAKLQLDQEGRVVAEGVDYADTLYARAIVGRKAIDAEALAPRLRTGWLRLPFRAGKLVNLDDDKIQAAEFRLGPTEARSPENEGAGGTMAIPIPLGVHRVLKFRLAGEINEGQITVRLNRGGWDPGNKSHQFTTLIDETIAGGKNKPYEEIYTVPNEYRELHTENHTLAVWLKSTQKSSVSLIAVQFEY